MKAENKILGLKIKDKGASDEVVANLREKLLTYFDVRNESITYFEKLKADRVKELSALKGDFKHHDVVKAKKIKDLSQATLKALTDKEKEAAKAIKDKKEEIKETVFLLNKAFNKIKKNQNASEKEISQAKQKRDFDINEIKKTLGELKLKLKSEIQLKKASLEKTYNSELAKINAEYKTAKAKSKELIAIEKKRMSQDQKAKDALRKASENKRTAPKIALALYKAEVKKLTEEYKLNDKDIRFTKSV